VELQKRIMNEAAELVNNLIENKLALTVFNADYEINLSEFLTQVNSERQFHKHYRDLAMSWLEEICKPTRRFKKMTADDLEIDRRGAGKKTVTLHTQ
jgi:chromodomain-helicase-DNA-binding protein 7